MPSYSSEVKYLGIKYVLNERLTWTLALNKQTKFQQPIIHLFRPILKFKLSNNNKNKNNNNEFYLLHNSLEKKIFFFFYKRISHLETIRHYYRKM